MSYTKRQLVDAAMAEIGLASYAFDLMPEQRESALRRLDSLMAEWNARGLRLGYPVPDNPADSDIDVDSNIPDAAWEAVITNLALRLAPSYGKQVNIETKVAARHSLNTILARAALPAEMKLPSMPSGAGNKSIDSPFTPDPSSDLIAGQDSTLDFN
jgi:hypothetical protein